VITRACLLVSLSPLFPLLQSTRSAFTVRGTKLGAKGETEPKIGKLGPLSPLLVTPRAHTIHQCIVSYRIVLAGHECPCKSAPAIVARV